MNQIDWKSKINPRYIVLFRHLKDEIESKYGKKFFDLQEEIQSGAVKVGEIESKYLLVKLAGWRELAQLRGYSSVLYNIKTSTPEYCSTECIISWLPFSEETQVQLCKTDPLGQVIDKGEFTPFLQQKIPPQTFSALANASLENVADLFRLYLPEMAENRSFARAVRNYLNIEIKSEDELPPEKVMKKANAAANSPQDTLIETVKAVLDIEDFDGFKAYLRAEFKKNKSLLAEGEPEIIKNATDFSDIPSTFALKLTGYLRK